MLLNDRGHPGVQVDYDWLEYDKQAPPLLRKTMHPLSTVIDPDFNVKYDEATHGAYLCKNMKIDHLSADKQLRITKLVQKHWCVFNPDELKFPVVGYEGY